MGFHKQLEDVLEHLGDRVFGHTQLVSQITIGLHQCLLYFWP